MAGVLLLASPILYVYIPELRSLGRAAGLLYFLPIQTKFYAVIPRGEARVKSFKDAAILVKNALRITTVGKTRERTRSKKMSFRNKMTPSVAEEHLAQHLDAAQHASDHKAATFDHHTIEQILEDPKLTKENQLSVTLVQNMLPGANNILEKKVNHDRILIARGPASFASGVGALKKYGIFLFIDIVVVAQKIKKNRKYINARGFLLGPHFTIHREGSTLTIGNDKGSCSLALEPETNAIMWEKYVKFCQDREPNASSQIDIVKE